MTSGTAGYNGAPPPRGQITGWSTGAVRRHTRWLYSVGADELDGQGLAVTLTVRDIPETAEAFHRARRALVKRLERLGLVRLHWVIEWTRRRRPHLHMAAYFPDGMDPVEVARLRNAIVTHWTAIAEQWGAGSAGQYVLPIEGAAGWLKYLSKHAARGVAHYQRQGIPEGWTKSGRLWGYTGEWPTGEPQRVSLSREAHWEFRRLVRSWRVADARSALREARNEEHAAVARRRIRSARRMLRCSRIDLSQVRGVSEWVDEGTALAFVALLLERGHPVLVTAQ